MGLNTQREKEIKHLSDVVSKFEEVKEDVGLLLKSLPDKYKNNEELLESLSLQYSNFYRVLEAGIKKPYFARIDFQEETGNKEICYIGKVGVHDFDNNLITVDWRSPIASLYYDSNIGKAKYSSPSGIISGEMLLKRQYTIENSKLIDYTDVDTVSNDEMLKPYLNVNADNRLKNIVSSIQSEQNEIIRKYIFDNMIVQGVAGSGKTTVALHRIAYLAYNYRNIVNSDQFMVIGPNKFFIHYISSVLPDLDVTNVKQLTYLELVEEVLKEKIKFTEKQEKKEISRFKQSLEYKEVLDKYLAYLEKNKLFLEEDFSIRGFLIFTRKKLKQFYKEIDKEFYSSFSSRIKRLLLLVNTEIKNNISLYEKKLTNLYFERLEKEEDHKKLKKDYDYVKNEVLNRYCENELKKYFNFLNRKTSTLYKEFLENASIYLENNLSFDTKLGMSDLPGLLYLHSKIHDNMDLVKIRHTVVDEAQDYGKFHFYTMKKVLAKSSFSIFGDLAQSIYDYKAIDNWEEVARDVFLEDCSIDYLLKSYRTTVEIMEEANKVLKHIGLKEGQPVIRHGKKVEYISTHKNLEKTKEVLDLLLKENYSTLAIICKDEKECKEVFSNLKDKYPILEVNKENLDYLGGICCVSSEYAKGLEFDAVVLYNASSYDEKDNTDMKHLYVAMTRALHEMYILYQDELFLLGE